MAPGPAALSASDHFSFPQHCGPALPPYSRPDPWVSRIAGPWSGRAVSVISTTDTVDPVISGN